MDPHVRFAAETDNTLEHLYWRLVDPLTWEFSLRPETRFSDGSPVTAEDVACALARVPRIEGSPGSHVIFTRAIAGVEVVDPRTVRIRPREPYPFVPVDMARIFILPASPGEDIRRAGFSGPWKPETWRPGETMELVPNPHWLGGRSRWARVSVRTISDDTARTAALLSGAVQAIAQMWARVGVRTEVALQRTRPSSPPRAGLR